jgi:hypothetical protein
MFEILAQNIANPNALDVLTNVESLYDHQFNHLTTIFIGGFVIVTLVVGSVPFLVQWIQRSSFSAEKDRILNQIQQEIRQLQENFKKDLAADSGAHYLQHALNVPEDESFNIDRISLVLTAIAKFAEAEEIPSLRMAFESLEPLQFPKYSYGRDVYQQHDYLVNRHKLAFNAVKKKS